MIESLEILETIASRQSLQLFRIVFFSFFWIHGFHAITRKDKLLSFLALRIDECDLLCNQDFVQNATKQQMDDLIESAKKKENLLLWKHCLKYLSEPFSECLVCMSSFWTIYWFLVFYIDLTQFDL